jgi:hypothetical protein
VALPSNIRAGLAIDASSSLDWVTANLPRFAPDLDHVSSTLSTFGELAILYAYAEAWSSDLAELVSLDHHLHAWRQLIVSHCAAQAYVESARKQVSIAYAFVVPYLMLRTTGYRSAAHERLVRRMQSEGPGERRCWAELFGTLAVSYARSADVAAVAAIVRAAAHLSLTDAWLDEAQAWLLDQQAAGGYFGLVSRELAHLRADDNEGCDEDVCLRLTVEVLWAICEIVAARSQRASGTIGVVEAAA